MCNNCIHNIVCSKYIATGGVNSCEHYKEERKGRWIEDEWVFVCSECDKWLDVSQGSAEMNYCPHCGADMKGD